MSKRSASLQGSSFNKRVTHSARVVAMLAFAIVGFAMLSGCDRGAGTQVETARKFADAVTRNNVPLRDSLIATSRYKELWNNDYVASDMISWFRTFYNFQDGHFVSTARADVDANLKEELEGGLMHPGEIEETGSVRVKSPIEGEQPAYFLMVKQKDQPWRVAFVTKGQMSVNFK